MLLFVEALIATTLASGAWCAGDLMLPRLHRWWQTSRRISFSGVALLAVLIAAGVLRFALVPAHHAMYLDEPWYAEAACNLWRFGRLVLCEQTWMGATWSHSRRRRVGRRSSPLVCLFGCDSAIGISIVAFSAWRRFCSSRSRRAVRGDVVGGRRCGRDRRHPSGSCRLVGNRRDERCRSAVAADRHLWGADLRADGAPVWQRSPSRHSVQPRRYVRSRWCQRWRSGRRARCRPTRRMHRLAVAIAMVSPAAPQHCPRAALTMNESISGGAFLAGVNVVRNPSLAHGESLPVHATVVAFALLGALALARSHRRGVCTVLSAECRQASSRSPTTASTAHAARRLWLSRR
jgi:hypothetical protein